MYLLLTQNFLSRSRNQSLAISYHIVTINPIKPPFHSGFYVVFYEIFDQATMVVYGNNIGGFNGHLWWHLLILKITQP